MTSSQALPHDGRTSLVLDGESMRRSWRRVAHEVVERNGLDGVLVCAGVPTRGVPLARRLAEQLRSLGADVTVIELDVEAHRDDRAGATARIRARGGAGAEVDGQVVVVVDDVLFHGRTARAALDALTEMGRPAAVQLAVMVDRGHRELPIRADYVGKNLPTRPQDRVQVCLEETDGQDAIVVMEKADG